MSNDGGPGVYMTKGVDLTERRRESVKFRTSTELPIYSGEHGVSDGSGETRGGQGGKTRKYIPVWCGYTSTEQL